MAQESGVQDSGSTEVSAEPSPSSLISPEFLADQWIFYSGKKDSVASQTWSYIVDPESKLPQIVCTGLPNGYIRTKRKYRNFELKIEWKYPSDANGNSGILLHTNGDDRLWPTSIQVQLQQPLVGSVFPSGGAKTDNEVRNVPMLSRPVNQWNHCVITCIAGEVTVSVNGEEVGTVTGCDPDEGNIALQSEGSEIHFRNIEIRELPQSVLSMRDLRKQSRRNPMRFVGP